MSLFSGSYSYLYQPATAQVTETGANTQKVEAGISWARQLYAWISGSDYYQGSGSAPDLYANQTAKQQTWLGLLLLALVILGFVVLFKK